MATAGTVRLNSAATTAEGMGTTKGMTETDGEAEGDNDGIGVGE
jgi:hypothetical protein